MTPMLCAGILQAAIFATGADAATAPALPEGGNAKPAVAKSDTYKEAHRVTTATGKPMVVMVGTDWCGPCQMMKKKILPRVREGGLLRKVAFAIVNADRDRELAEKLTDGGPVPQLVMFRRNVPWLAAAEARRCRAWRRSSSSSTRAWPKTQPTRNRTRTPTTGTARAGHRAVGK